MEKKITITVDVDGNSISREFNFEPMFRKDLWNDTIEDMLDTLEKSNEKKF